MKRNIALVAGGDTSEFEVSMKSAKGIMASIDTQKYTMYLVVIHQNRWSVLLDTREEVLIDRNDFSFLKDNKKVTFDYAYITIHGTPGEDGLLQGYFDMLHIPYSCCGVLAAALTYNKFACNQYLKVNGVNIAESLLLRKGYAISNEDVVNRVKLPCFIKPNKGGSSFGITKVYTVDQIQPAIQKARLEADEVVIESFLEGTEMTCGIYKGVNGYVRLPVTEVLPKNDFFDYDAKYNGAVTEITPAPIPEELRQRIQDITAVVYEILHAEGIIRIDYIVSENEKIFILEVNTTPGMTPSSFIPQQIEAAGLNLTTVLSDLIELKFAPELPEDGIILN